MPRLFADMFLVAWPAYGEIVECGETEDFSEFCADSWCLIYDVNDDAASMAQTSNHWKWWKISLEDEDCDVLVIAPNEWE